jgi:hypothetical protein
MAVRFPRLQRFSSRTCLVPPQLQTMSAGQDSTPYCNGMITIIPRFPLRTSLPCRSFLCSRSQPKPRRNLRSRYTDTMESIHPRSYRSGSSNRASFTTRPARSSSTTSLTSLTNTTTSYQDSDNGRLGSGFSILKKKSNAAGSPT